MLGDQLLNHLNSVSMMNKHLQNKKMNVVLYDLNARGE